MNTINKNSWHYRLLSAFDAGVIKWQTDISLCPYIRSVIFHMVIVLGLVILALFTITSMLAPFFIPINKFILIVCVLGWIVAGVISMYWVIESDAYTQEKYFWTKPLHMPKFITNLNDKTKVKKEPSIFKLYMKAIHNKVCPIMRIK